MAFNAFVGGIQPGGLTNDFEVKILICFLLDSLKKNSPGAALSDGEQPGLSFDELNEIFQETGLVNYFEFAESMSELEKTEHIRRQMTPDGSRFHHRPDLPKKPAFDGKGKDSGNCTSSHRGTKVYGRGGRELSPCFGRLHPAINYPGYRLRPFELKCVFTHRRGVHSGKGTYSE